MVSTSYLVFIVFIFQCGIVISKASTLAPINSPIPLSELVEELRREPEYTRTLHLAYILVVESYGDHLYDVSETLSAECSTTIKAGSLMFEKLAISGFVAQAVLDILKRSARDLQRTQQLEEHPLELFCRRITTEFKMSPASVLLVRAFEKARIEVANFSSVSGRPPYYGKLVKPDSFDSLVFEVVEKLIVPELARLMAVGSFWMTSTSGMSQSANSSRLYFFTKSCWALAVREEFADSMQNIFAKVMNETIADIAVADRHEQIKACGCSFWWRSKMTRAMYGYIALDPTLKTELENTAVAIGKQLNATSEDINFSNL